MGEHIRPQGSGLTLAFIGCGNMGSAILTGLLARTQQGPSKGETPGPISKFMACVSSDRSAQRLKSKFSDHLDQVTILYNDNLLGFKEADVILLACKPYMAETVLSNPAIRDYLRGKLVISILASTTAAILDKYIYGDSTIPSMEKCCIVDAMPNMAAQIGESITIIPIPSPPPPKEFEDIVSWIFSSIGQTKFVRQDLFGASSILAGATPAMFALAFDGILDGAVSSGIPRGEAQEILAQSLLGLAKLLQDGHHPGVLREQISSPRGVTMKALDTMEKGATRHIFSQAFKDAVPTNM